ncbi:MAG: hypothetical protein LBR68_00630 [Lachnoclostridium sp.]|jgi:hypothetical protein|nr:hypothetical protein [Lachnoclostridium sp.]
MANLYVHIGLPKTGTSAIQKFLAANRSVLQTKGYCFPDFNIIFEGIAINRNGHFLIQEYFDDNKNRLLDKEEELVRSCLNKVIKLAGKYPNIIVSDEKLWRGSKEHDPLFWDKLNKWGQENNIQIKVIVYLRRQDYFIQSNWGELVKQKSVHSFIDYVKNEKIRKPELDFYSHLQPIASILGKENLIVRIYNKEISLIKDFFSAIDLELTEDFKFEDIVKNTSFVGVYLEVKRLLNRLPEYKEKRSFVLNLLREIQTEEGKPVHFQGISYFTPEEQKNFMDKFEEGNAAIAREYLNRHDGILFEEEDTGEPIPAKYTKEELVEVCGKVIWLQQKKIENLEKKLGFSKKSHDKAQNKSPIEAQNEPEIKLSLWEKFRKKIETNR